MVVNAFFHSSALMLAVLSTPSSEPVSPPAVVLPVTIPCETPLSFASPDVTDIHAVQVVVNNQDRIPQKTASGFSVDINLGTDCNGNLKIVAGGHTENFMIALPPAKADVGTRQSNLAPDPNLKSPSRTPEFTLFAAVAAAVAALLAFLFTGLLWFKQQEAVSLARSLSGDIKSLLKKTPDFYSRDPSPEYTANLSKRIAESVAANQKSGKDSGMSEAKHSQLLGKIDTVESKIGNVMTRLAKIASDSVPGIVEPHASAYTLESPRTETYSYESPAARYESAPVLSFEDAYNSAVPGAEEKLPGVLRVVAVNSGKGTDKNPTAKEPLIEEPSGPLRVFFLQNGDLYLAPSLAMRADGIGGTHQRPWAYLFAFEGAGAATRLKKAAKVQRENGQYEIVDMGIMA